MLSGQSLKYCLPSLFTCDNFLQHSLVCVFCIVFLTFPWSSSVRRGVIKGKICNNVKNREMPAINIVPRNTFMYLGHWLELQSVWSGDVWPWWGCSWGQLLLMPFVNGPRLVKKAHGILRTMGYREHLLVTCTQDQLLKVELQIQLLVYDNTSIW